MFKKKFVVGILLLFPFMLFAQTDGFMQGWYRDWRIGAMGGVSYLAAEIKKDFSLATMDMNSEPKISFDYFITKRFENNIEIGFEYEKNYFSGDKTYPDKINWLIYDSKFNNEISHFIPNPIYYKTNISSWFLNLSYNFPNFSSIEKNHLNLNMYVKGGVGLSSLGVEMGYKDPLDYERSNLQNPLYEKGQGVQPTKDLYGTFHVGTGVNYYLSPRISINSELIFLFVSTDYLDGVKNFEVTKLPNDQVAIARRGILGAVGEFRIGISYHFNFYKPLIYDGLWKQTFEEFTNEFYFDKDGDNSTLP